MATGVIETDYGQKEGGDTLKAFLLEHKSVLKKGVDPLYAVLIENEIEEYEELIDFAEMGLRTILDPKKEVNKKLKIKDVHIEKLINILRNIPQSQIYKDANKEKVVVVLSDDEYKAMNKIKAKSARIKQYKQNITDTIQVLTKNKVSCKVEIDKQTDYAERNKTKTERVNN